jgi:hypothetical protein
MSAHPIIFSGPEVRAIIEGRKTQTRKPIKNPAHLDGLMLAGDCLWVREAFGVAGGIPQRFSPVPVLYRADHGYTMRWRPSIHMPRWASRLTLEILNVRAERLKDIINTPEDIQREGFRSFDDFFFAWDKMYEPRRKEFCVCRNPWVWVIEFRRVE